MSVHSMRTGVLGGEHRAPFYTFLPLQQWLNLWLLESSPQNLSKCKISPDGRTDPFFFLLRQPEGYQRGKCIHCANDTAIPIAPLLGPSINCNGYKEGTGPFSHIPAISYFLLWIPAPTALGETKDPGGSH